MSFDALLAALPFTALLLAAVGYALHLTSDTPADVHQLLDRFIPAHGAGPYDPFAGVEDLAVRLAASRGRLSAYGLPLYLWFATRFFSTIRQALNDIFHTTDTRPFLRGLLMDLGLVVITTVLFAGNAVLSAGGFFPGVLHRLAALLSALGFGVLLFFVTYYLAPVRRMRWDTALVASLVAWLAFEAAKRLYGLYLARFVTVDRLFSDTNLIALVLFIFWLYYMACAFLIGAEVAEEYDRRRQDGGGMEPA